jgi:hypothetical protein
MNADDVRLSFAFNDWANRRVLDPWLPLPIDFLVFLTERGDDRMPRR